VEQRSPAAYVAEFIGTFALVFFITSVVVLFVSPGGGGGSDWAVVGLVHAFVLFMLVQSFIGISGAHFNPAVTAAFVALRRIRPNDAVIYILLQLSGGVAGALMTKFILSDKVAEKGSAIGSASPEVGTPGISHTLLGGTFQGVVLEGLGAFFLVWAIVSVAVNPKAAKEWAGLVIGATLGLIVMVGGPLTGGSFNPARYFGPALVSSHWTDWWLYIVGPPVGAVLAALIYKTLFIDNRLGGASVGGGSTGA
jgi:glycerol uptake facilitator protein